MVWFVNKDTVMQIFIHIPKTGGTSIEKALNLRKHESGYGNDKNKKAMQHYLWTDYKKKFDRVFDISYKFAVCRNPYDRIVSDYYWLPVLGHKGSQSIDDFITHCECVVRQKLYTTIRHDHFIPQHEYIFDKNDKLMVDKLFKFENFEKIEDFLKTKYNINTVPKCNVCEQKEKLTLNDKQKERIYKIYKKDFELLGYPK